MAKYPFLSDEWVAEAKKIREEVGGNANLPAAIKANLVITEVPFGSNSIDAHLDTSSGSLDMDLGHLDDAEVKLTLDYATAKAILLDGDQQAAMQAFMAGKIRIEGDMAKIMMLQTATPDPSSEELAKKLQEITE